MSKIYTTNNGFATLTTIADLATVLKKCPNPTPDIQETELNQIQFNPEAKKLPSDLWSAIVKLYFHFAKEMNSEVRVELYKHLTTNEWKVGVPKQEVSTALCTNHDGTDVVDILTGEQFNPESDEFGAWYQFGTSHSHGKLTLDRFSVTDDADELKKEGPHILVSCIDLVNNTYKVTGSVVWNGQRQYVDYKHLIETSDLSDVTFHPNCLKQVSKLTFNKSKFKFNSKKCKSNKLSKSYKHKSVKPTYVNWYDSLWNQGFTFENDKDPFYVSDNISPNSLILEEEVEAEKEMLIQSIEDQLLSDDLLMRALTQKKLTVAELKEAYEEAFHTLEYFTESEMYKGHFI